jgi:hypothetical protein
VFSSIRSQYKDTLRREIVTKLFALHRTMFMGERIQYASRILESRNNPDDVLSIVADGMQQTHCELPYMKNLFGSFPKMKQHLQGITQHGKRTRIYRTYNNISNGANLAIHTLLLSLEEEYKLKGKLQRKIYIQVDGGSENANWTFLAAMEMLIGLEIGVEEVWVIRMPKGHNHADQDGKFALIWVKVRDMSLLCPLEYENAIMSALKRFEGGCAVHDIFVIPDYTKFLHGKAVHDMFHRNILFAIRLIGSYVEGSI